MTLGVTVQYFDGCPSWRTAADRVREAASRTGLEVAVRLEQVETLEDAARLGFVGSPSVADLERALAQAGSRSRG